MARNALGKGLGALIGGNTTVSVTLPEFSSGEKVHHIHLDRIVVSPFQPRKTFSEQDLSDLVASILEHGVIQPLIVRKVGDKFELIAGERRWRASRLAGLTEVPVILRQAGDMEVLELAMVENLQRSDLNPIEEADGYALLAARFQLTQEQIAQKVGRNRATVANALRLTTLALDVKELVRHRQLSVGHAKVLLALSNHTQQNAVALEIIKRDLSVRNTEKFIRELDESRTSSVASSKKINKKGATADWRDLELRLQRLLGTKIKLVGTPSKGHLAIDYYNPADLERILSVLGYRGD
ncbi:MAG: ParB/RepB/Spo0J family partition protein [Blastochloris sp.]|nr:ParB/RepB/Spo0J family partition protein [Blastochloris sp.]